MNLNGLKKFSLIFLLIFLYSCGPKVDCQLYHTGQYELVDDNRDVLIERDREFQTETVRSTGEYTKFRIVWLNPCTYRLFFLEGNEALYEAWKESFMEVMILEGSSEEYSYKATFSQSGKSELGKVRKL